MDKHILDAVAAVLKDERKSIAERIDELQAAIESKADVSDLQLSAINRDELVDALSKDLDGIMKDVTAEQDELRHEVLSRLDSIKDGKDGRDGIDNPAIAPVEIDEHHQAHKGLIIAHRGGLYQAIRNTNGNPDIDAGNWKCFVDGVADVTGEFDAKAGEYVFSVEKTNGKREQLRIERMPAYLPPGDHKSIEGDYFLDGSTLNLYLESEWVGVDLRGADGEKGLDGKDGVRGRKGRDGVGIDDIYLVDKTLTVLLTSGETKEVLIDVALPEQEDIDQEIKRYAGTWHTSKSYDTGDVVTAYNGLFLCLNSTRDNPNDSKNWVQMHGGGGGGGGIGGGSGGPRAFLGPQWIVPGTMQMNSQGISNVAPPRPGTVGQKDATNKQYVDQAIAAGALYQGIYTVSTNNPDLTGKADTGFVAPATGAHVNKGPVGWTPKAGSIIVDFDLTNGPFHDSFPLTINAPLPFEIRFSNGHITKINIAPATYASWVDLFNEIHDKVVNDPIIDSFHGHHATGDLIIGVETVAPVYATYVTDQQVSPFPPAAPGANNTILNTYNWVVQTADENTPEGLPPGLPGLEAGTLVKNSDVLQWSSTTNGFEVISGSSLTQSFSDQRYWQISNGNMSWVDQAYNKGAVVYGAKTNAWFVAQQNITAGTAEPGDVNAGAVWRKINSTYGATVFFGKGDYDTSDTTAANNWGMPAGTYPSGQQPLNGDSYFDVTTGTTVDFSVTQGAVSYVITGTFDSATQGQGAIGNVTVLNTWPVGAPVCNAGEGYYASAAHTFTSGTFAGTVMPNGFWLVYSGDPDADNDGWVLIDPVASGAGPWPWSINTPHPQNTPDTVSAHVTYGTIRRFNITTAGADGNVIQLAKGFPSVNALFSFEIRDTGTNGSIYTGQVSLSANTAKLDMTPSVVRVDVNSFSEVLIGYNATDGYYLGVVIKADGVGRTFEILIDTQDFDLGLLSDGNNAVKPPAEKLKSFATEADFKPASATRIMYHTDGGANNTYGYSNTRLHAELVSTKANTLYKIITNTGWYGARFNDNAKVRIKVFYTASNNGSGGIGPAANVFRCIGVNIVSPFVKSYRIVGNSQSMIEIEVVLDQHDTSGYEVLEMNFDMIGAADVQAGNHINYGMKAVSGVAQMAQYVKFPEVSIFEIASWT